MSDDKKSLGKTVLGWFVVQEEDGDDASVAEEVEEITAKPAKIAPPPPPKKVAAQIAKYDRRPPPPPPQDDAPASMRLPGKLPDVPAGGAHDAKVFAGVYAAAHISADEQERVTKTLGLLQSLPSETSQQVRRQIVEASLKAFGIPIEQIIEAGAQEIQALEAYVQHGERRTQEILSDATRRIDKLTAEIEEVRKLMELQVASQADLVRSSNGEKLKVQTVLEFFGQEAVARVVKASPKLVEPK